MPGETSGLARDIRLVRRRAWLFVPAFIVGVLLAFGINRVIGQANAVAVLKLDTVLQELVIGGDRGLRIFEAQSMTTDDAFKEKVLQAIGDPDFDYARFNISLFPISVADGVSRGNLTVSIKDSSKAEAERLRQAWVDVFVTEFVAQDGLFRQRFIDSKREVLEIAEAEFAAAYAALLPRARELGLPLDELLRGSNSLREEYNRTEADLRARLAMVRGALDSPAPITGSLVGVITGTPVPDAEAVATLRNYQSALAKAVAAIEARREQVSDGGYPVDFQTAVDSLRALTELKFQAASRLDQARVAVTTARSTVEVDYSFSGGVAGTLIGRVAVVIAVTLVLGLIAIYTLEWLSQVSLRSDPGNRRNG